MSSWDWIVLSGIPSSHPGGTGKLMRHLEKELLGSGRFDGTIIYSADGETLTTDQLDLLIETPKVVIFHPQMLGLKQTLFLLSARESVGQITHIYLLDSFFFCRRSYNHIDSEIAPCLRCIGQGNSEAGDRMGCQPWPKAEPAALDFIRVLHQHAVSGSVHFYAQTETQASLASEHFGGTAIIEVAGLWCDDWSEHFDSFLAHGIRESAPGPYDIVYHGSRDMAKGLGWILTVASKTSHLSYLVPLDRGEANFSGPPNVMIQPMRWNEGLFDAIKGSAITIVPSLWSAPIEGALVKSIVTARATAIIQNESSYSREISDGVCLTLPQDTDDAAGVLSEAIDQQWKASETPRQKWAEAFQAQGRDLINKLNLGST